MKAFVAVLLLIAVASAATEDDLFKQFSQWTVKHGKVYDSISEHTKRFETFKDNYNLIRFMNRQNRGTFAINKFADLTSEEFEAMYLHPIKAPSVRTHETFKYVPRNYPDSLDWRTKGAVNAIKDQASCGSCWAFSAVQNMESVYFIENNKAQNAVDLPNLSEQQLVDCEHDCMIYPGTTETVCDEGCDGGLMPNAMTYAIREGMMSEVDYPYAGVDQDCKYDQSKAKIHFIGWQWVDKNEDAMVAALNDIGPLSIGVCASSWSFYSGGIFNGTCTSLNHGVGLVGYGVSGKSQYWIIRNSWGEDWGEQGYIRLARGSNRCVVNNFVSSVHAK